jgi:diadenosine tetraphosphate (Ap4A) HIT family hydrolase
VIAKAHAVEPFDLPDTDQAAFWRECMAVAKALHDLLSPVKMNYEIHGNTLPHLHMHLLPRQVDDAFAGRPIDLNELHHSYTENDLDRLRLMVASISSS